MLESRNQHGWLLEIKSKVVQLFSFSTSLIHDSSFIIHNFMFCLLFTVCCLLTIVFGQVAQIDYFKEGVELYKQGKLDKAYEVLENALKESRELNPDIIRFFVFELEKDLLVEMIAKGGKLARTAKRILELSKAAMEGYKLSEEELDKQIAIIKDGKSPFDKKHIAINKLILIGKKAIPVLVDALGDEKNETFRTNAVITLTKFQDIAVIPLVASLESNNVLQKRNTLIVLANVQSKVASPYISKIAKSKKEDEGIRTFSKKVLRKWFPYSKSPTKTLFTRYAYYILKSPPKLERDLEDLSSFWEFKNQKLIYTDVYAFETKYLIAEQYLLEALKLDRSFLPAQIMLVLTYAKYHLQVLGFLRTLKNENERNKLKVVLEKTRKRFESISSFPTDVLYEVLKRTREDKEYDVSEEIIKLLGVVGNFEDAMQNKKGKLKGVELFNSLLSADKPTRYSACLSILKWQPHKKFPNIEKWHKVAEEILSEENIWRILLVDKDQRFYNKLKGASQYMRLSITQTIDTKKALSLARSFPAYDLIIIGVDYIDEVVYSVQLAGLDEQGERKKVDIYLLKALSEDIRLKYTPTLVSIRNEEEKSKIIESIFSVGPDGDVRDIISKDDKIESIALKLRAAFESSNLFEESKRKAESFILDFERELQKLDITKTPLQWQHIIPQLIKNAEFKTVQISLEAIKAFGILVDKRAVSPLVKIANGSRYSTEQRKQSLLSLMNVLGKYPDALNQIDIDALFNVLRRSKQELRELIPKVLGKAELDPKVRLKLVEELKK